MAGGKIKTRKSPRLEAPQSGNVRKGLPEISDDDFVSPPVHIVRRSKDHKQSEKKKKRKKSDTVSEGPSRVRGDLLFKSRCSPFQLVLAISKLTKVQIDDLTGIGLGQIVDVKCKVLHTQLSRWLLEAFDADTCTLVFPAGKIKVTEEHVQYILGLPRGEKDIILPSKACKVNTTANEWKRHFKLEGAVTISRVRKIINQTKQGGNGF